MTVRVVCLNADTLQLTAWFFFEIPKMPSRNTLIFLTFVFFRVNFMKRKLSDEKNLPTPCKKKIEGARFS